MKKLLTGLVAGAALLGFVAAAKAETTLTVSTYTSYKFWLVGQTIENWGRDIEAATDGRVKVRVLKQALGDGPAHYDMARDGVADITLGVQGYTPGRFLLTDVGSLPFVGDTSVARSVALWRTFKKFPTLQEEYKDVHVVSIFTTSARNFWNAKRQINSVADFNGLKMRASGGLESDLAAALGMTPLLQPVNKVYELLSNGVADAVVFPSETIESFNLTKVLKYGTKIPGGFSATPLMFVMNKSSYDSLSAEDKIAFDALSGEAFARRQGLYWDRLDAQGEAAFIRDGGQIDQGSEELLEGMRKSAEPIIEKWTTQAKAERGADAQAMIDYYVEQVEALE
ncbi:TRAP transporter substrate-binding protein [Afifella pfennigii]|uniref:TRAP transporter substrate-binding protein n=1 Tax=Afifella pfennigii TaxID=209897 RepID=UPI00068CDDE3|nr:TRAP transporter substrate-binding protein [Afifella pfennigii]